MRAFIAVDLEASEALLRLLRELQGARAKLRVVPPENFHITLKFLGNVDEGLVPQIVEVMKGAVGGISAFEVVLSGSGAFPNLRAPRVLWVGVESGDTLASLAQRLDEGLQPLGFQRETRPFSPHATVARVKGPKGRERIVRIVEDHSHEVFGKQTVEAIKLKSSQLGPSGAVYSDVAVVPLG